MKRADIQNEVKKGLRALNIIGIDQSTLEKAKEEISESIPPESIPLNSIPPEGIPLDGIDDRALVNITKNFCKVDMDVLDKAAAVMDVYEQAVYRQLYRLSYGNGQNFCTIGYGRLGQRANMKRNGIINVLERLEQSDWILTLAQTTKGKTYRVYLPCENGIESETTIKSVPLKSIPPEGIPSDSILGVPLKSIPSDGTPGHEAATNKGRKASVPLKGIPSDRPNIDLDHSIDPLSPDLVKLFYTGIGQQRISKVKREKGNSVLQELQKEGFSPEDIQFAIEWTLTPGNTTEKVHDFSIISHTIGQALSAREAGQEAADAAQKEAARVRAAEEEQKRLEGEIADLRSKLSEEYLVELRKRAEEELAQTDGIKKQFINEPLITAKENQILRRKNL
jgi:hypothetical protein